MATYALIQARMESTRLPGKVLLPIAGKPMIEHLLDVAVTAVGRAYLGGYNHRVIVTVPANDENARLRHLVHNHRGVVLSVWPGKKRDVLAEYAFAARDLEPFDIVVRMTADCPCITADMIEFFASIANSGGAYIYTNRPCDADGYDMEAFPAWLLREAFIKATTAEEREHVCPWMYAYYEEGKGIRRFSVMGNPHSGVAPGKWSVDTEEEYEYVKAYMEQTQDTGGFVV